MITKQVKAYSLTFVWKSELKIRNISIWHFRRISNILSRWVYQNLKNESSPIHICVLLTQIKKNLCSYRFVLTNHETVAQFLRKLLNVVDSLANLELSLMFKDNNWLFYTLSEDGVQKTIQILETIYMV